MDYGFAHYTVVLLGCRDGDGNTFVVDEHAQRMWLPQRHAEAIKAMVGRHQILKPRWGVSERFPGTRPLEVGDLRRFVAGADVFSRQSDGTTIGGQYHKHGINLRCASTDRVNGWAEVMQGFGEPDAGLGPNLGLGTVSNGDGGTGCVRPTLFIHRRCARLVETLPALQHDPNRPEDVLKVDADDDGVGGDDAADCLRYLVGTKARTVEVRKLRGL
jgi:hypothetical protein